MSIEGSGITELEALDFFWDPISRKPKSWENIITQTQISSCLLWNKVKSMIQYEGIR